ncbi:MAG: (2Fe-2S)-binding protein [Eggerthellaceae bacterium]|jgi:NAD(P)H-nitrite reductase large subunit
MIKMVRTAPTEDFVPQPDDDLIICRCEEVTKGEIRRAVHDGLHTTNEVKRWLRCGMGLCQGQTCQRNFQNIIARELGCSVGDLGKITGRSPARPVVIGTFANEKTNLKED